MSSGEMNVDYVPEYLYLGVWFIDSGKSESAMALHETESEAILNKFSIFCAKNTQMPFQHTRVLFDAAVTTLLLYGSESWLTNRIKGIEKLQ